MDENKEIKPGWKSTESWVTILVSLIAIAGAMGLIDPLRVVDVQTEVTEVVKAIAGAIVAISLATDYSGKRTSLKMKQLEGGEK